MIKRHLLVGLLLYSSFFTSAQSDTPPEVKVNKTEVALLYNQYIQDGDNSAVTGGQGTEKLVVYGPSLKVKRSFGKNKIDFQVGADVISSASTDNIDFVVSSASIIDTRSYVDAQYSRVFEQEKLSVHAGLGLSLESDYFSFLKYVGFEKVSKNEMQTYSAQLQIYNDDLRWGRLDEDYYRPIMLIYPIELSDRAWYDNHHRNSYNLKMGFTQVVDRRNILGFFARLSTQEGLLSTSFHRIYFSDGTLAVEQLPKRRHKSALAVKWNRFLNGNVVLKNTVNGYADNFGVLGLSLENETAIKLDARWVLSPNFRFYLQKGSKYFAPFQAHQSNEKYYTSDYDYANLQSYKTGLSVQYKPFSKWGKRLVFNTLSLNYQFYYRSDGLVAHICSFAMDFEFLHKKKHP